MPRIIIILLFTLLFSPSANAWEAGFSGGEDFSDFAPKYSEDSTHLEESFLYFEKQNLLTAATGMDKFTGPMGSGMSASFPVLDLRLAHFFDFRRALELRLANSRFTGTMSNSVLSSLNLTRMQNALTMSNNFFELDFFRLGLGLKYYTENEAPENWGIDNQTVWSPNFFFTMGLNYTRLAFSMTSANLREAFDAIVPHASIGADFFIKTPGPGMVKRPPTFTLEAQYTMIGNWLKMTGAQNTAGRDSIGDMVSFRTGVNFVF